MIGQKTKIGMMQINNSYSGQNYLPYSAGFLQAYTQKYAKNIDDFEFLLPIYKRDSTDKIVEKLAEADMVCVSTYNWNFRASMEIARRVKQNNPEAVIVLGGCEIPKRNTEEFLKSLPFADIACYGEGERVFQSILENYPNRSWNNVPSITYADEKRVIKTTARIPRIKNLQEIPSPYLEGVFDPLMKANTEEKWIALWETNRGCPFGCSYCEWGGEYHKSLYDHDLEKLMKEVDWFSQNKIEYIFCCDSNFGIRERDLEIAKKVAENKIKYGYPHAFSVQNTKNSSVRTFGIQKVLGDAGLNKGVDIAFQSFNPKTLKAIGRKNMSTETFYELQVMFNRAGVETYSDMIQGLPEETYETFTRGIELLIEKGQHSRIQFNHLSLLQNSEMGNPEYQKKYGLQFVEQKLINFHGPLERGDVEEVQKMIVATKTMSLEDLARARAFGWMTGLAYFDKLLQIPITVMNKQYGIGYKEMIETLMKDKRPTLSKVSEFFLEKARGIQRGEPEFEASKRWLGIWWPIDEYQMIEICTQPGRFDSFYRESQESLQELLKKKDRRDNEHLIEEAVELNRGLVKLPFQTRDAIIELPHNIWEFYRANLLNQPTKIEAKKSRYLVDKTSEVFNSWEDWCQKVVWYGNKKGAYLNNCTLLENTKGLE